MATGQRKFGQANFFRLCDWMKSNREMIERSRYTNAELRKLVQEAIQLDAPDSTLSEAKEVLKIKYQPKHKKGSKTGRYGSRLVARCLRDLMVKMGEPVPQELKDLIGGKVADRPADTCQPCPPPPVAGIPLKDVKLGTSLPVVNVK